MFRIEGMSKPLVFGLIATACILLGGILGEVNYTSLAYSFIIIGIGWGICALIYYISTTS